MRASPLERLLKRVQHAVPRTVRPALGLDHQHQNTAAPRAERIGQQLVAEHRRLALAHTVARHRLTKGACAGLPRVAHIADAKQRAEALHARGASVIGENRKGDSALAQGIKPMLLYPVIGIFLIGVIMTYVVEPPIGALNVMINNGLNSMNGAKAILLGALLGGMMSVDMGGPVNKAAYVFGTASIAAGNYNIMAAVMVGGMVPPLAIALATMFFKNKFTEEERKAGPTNIVMGLSFISEGAIPFAASDPLRVLPSCIIGSAVAGALSMAFNCTLMAPHGGIFVFLTVGHPLLYLVSLAVGSVVGCVILGLLKKDVSKR